MVKLGGTETVQSHSLPRSPPEAVMVNDSVRSDALQEVYTPSQNKLSEFSQHFNLKKSQLALHQALPQ